MEITAPVTDASPPSSLVEWNARWPREFPTTAITRPGCRRRSALVVGVGTGCPIAIGQRLVAAGSLPLLTVTRKVDVLEPATREGVQLRTLVVGHQPLLVASVPRAGRGAQLVAALAERGVPELRGFLGAQLPRGARVGFMIDTTEMRLVDDRDQALLRAPRVGLDPGWLEAARRLRGTMAVIAVELELGPETPRRQILERLDAAARHGTVRGAIIGVAEDRPTLPLVFE